MTADPITPSRGIRLKGGAPIPPAPSFGIYRPVALEDSHIGGVNELTHNHHVPVCVGCNSALPAHPTYAQGKKALRDHWRAEHGRAS